MNDNNTVELLLEKLMLNELMAVITSAGIPIRSLSVGQYREEAICLVKNGSCWIVYSGERGNKYDLTEFSQLGTACLEVLSRLASDQDTLDLMKEEFTETFKRRRRAESGLSAVETDLGEENVEQNNVNSAEQ